MPSLSHIIFGEPFPNKAELHERLDKVRGLAVFASDPISSNAYATEAIMTVLVILGSGALNLTMPIAIGIAALIALVVFSYTQTILHYPGGGGSYIVTKDNLGTQPSLLAGAALLIDYVLTVAVSVSAGVRAVSSAFPAAHDHRVLIALLVILLITWMNLRGIRESGSVFAIPTYAFVVGVLLVIVIGLVRYFGLLGTAPLPPHPDPVPATGALEGFAYIWLLLRAFAAGCTALTGIEAISDGVQAFKAPESINAAQTMVAMAVIAMTLFLGISFLATHMELVPTESNTILSQMTAAVAGRGILYYWVQIFTAAILFLAANTGYQDFPRLGSFLARDGFMPRWMMNRGDRLVFNSGIVMLAFLSSILVIIFQAEEITMLPLYALGVMLCFTLSQAGMVRLMTRIGQLTPGETLKTMETEVHYEEGWQWKRAVNATGAVVTGVVFLVLMATKFREGAWIVVVAIPLILLLFRWVKRHYVNVAEQLRLRNLSDEDLSEVADVILIPMADIHRGTMRALKYAERLSDHVRAVSIVTSEAQRERLLDKWARYPELTAPAELVLIDYEYRNVLQPLVSYITQVSKEEFPNQLITVAVPEFVPRSLPEQFLHNQTANLLRVRLRGQPNVVVIDVPYHL
ncbi:MAG: APC family permease [Anaerolineales bacterium]|nr:APC family permease [Anaerolineales bacterium]MCB9127675.1 APC family permease [Ardenticatenales bacterium]